MRLLACVSTVLGIGTALHPRVVGDPGLSPVAVAAAGTFAQAQTPKAAHVAAVASADTVERDAMAERHVDARSVSFPPPAPASAREAQSQQPTPVTVALSPPPPVSVREAAGPQARSDAVAAALQAKEHEEAVAPLARLYLATFDRAADYEGLDHYLDERGRGTPLAEIAEEFAGSAEFAQRYGALDNAGFVDRVWENVFGGTPDTAQRAQWIAELDAGMARGALMLAFSESAAYRAATSNEVFVTMAYAEALRSAPDARELSRWVALLDAGHPRPAVVAALLAGARGR